MEMISDLINRILKLFGTSSGEFISGIFSKIGVIDTFKLIMLILFFQVLSSFFCLIFSLLKKN